jgi:protein-L-isoaspartate(D-aspartate) O-methyltransferase
VPVTDADDLRARMVDALGAGGRVLSPAVEEALRAVPRHLFLPGVDLADAYADGAVPVQHVDGAATSSASQPSMVAIMLEQLALRPGLRVLEIGAGTGWNAALMARIVGPTGRVTSVDIDPDLVASAADHLTAAGVGGVELVCADGAFGHPRWAPYDRIVLTVGSADIRREWVAQLAPGGRLLVPLAVRGSQLSIAFDLGSDGVLRSDSVRGCSFIRLRGIGAEPETVVELACGDVLQVPSDGPGVDATAVDAALLDPGEPIAVGVPLGPQDVWDGFGFWLALTEPGAVRLLATGPGAHAAASALVTPPGAAEPGLAVVGPAPPRSAVPVRPFGPAGRNLAGRLLAALDAWTAAGSPTSSSWLISTGTPAPAEPGVVTVRTPPGRGLALSLSPRGPG